MAVYQEDIHRLSLSDNVGDRRQAARLLQEELESLPDKSVVWDDIHRLINDTDSSISEITAYTLGYFFKYVPEESKSIAWDDLVRLLEQAFVDNDLMLSRQTANALCLSFAYVPDDNKPQAWFYLTKIPVDGHFIDVIDDVASDFKTLFEYIPDTYKSQAWANLFRLMSVGTYHVKYCTISALSYVYSSVPDKSAVWDDFQQLVNDEDSYIRMCANHSLGKICIYEASESQNESLFQNLLGTAIQYFEKASNEKENFNPAKFCYPFYLSFEAVVFNTKCSMEEIAKHIANAKREVGQFENRAKLLRILDDLADVLNEIKSLEHLDFEDKKKRLRYCKRFCEHADYLIEDLREKVPHASGVLSKGLSIFDRNIRSLIFEIQEKAEEACREAKGTTAEPVTCSVNKEVQDWRIENPVQMAKNVSNLIFSLKSQVPNSPENEDIILKIDEIEQCQTVEDQFAIIGVLIPLLPAVSIQKDVSDIKKDTTEIKKISRRVDRRSQKILNLLRTPGGKIGTALTVGGFFTTPFLLLFPNDPNIGYMAVIFGSLIAIAFYSFS